MEVMMKENKARTCYYPPIYNDPVIASLPRVKLTENQQKVIRDKYLKNAPSYESWLYNVARNIALAEIFYSAKVNWEKILKNVQYEWEEYPIPPDEKGRMLLLHRCCKNYEEQDRNFKTFIKNLYEISYEDDNARKIVEEWALKFYKLMANWEFLPNSPTLMNAGRELQQLSACYVLPIDDSVEAWGEILKYTMLIHKSGGGTRFSGCRIRPKGDIVKTTKGIASGALSPFHMINHTTEEIKQGGTRRGANMGILPYHHPDILEFITVKAQAGKLENFNISVACDEKFFEAVKENKDIDLVNPRNGEVVKKINARELFDKIVETAWKTGDPGIILLDRINNSFSNPIPAFGAIEATNPCGEQPLLPYEPCNLGSINLSKFVKEGEIDWEKLSRVTKMSVRFLDDVIDVNNYPIDKIEYMAKGSRRIGLGVMGWAEMLVQLGIPYDSEEAIKIGEEVMKFINQKALEESIELAQSRGVFPFFKDSIYDRDGKYYKEWAGNYRVRNSARTTIAPTGTIGIAAGLQGGGIEPFFGIVYVRYNAQALDALNQGKQPNAKDVFYEVNPYFKKIAIENDFWGLSQKELWEKIIANYSSIRGVPEIPEKIQKIFPTTRDISVEYHVKHQAAFQKYVNNGVSKTINLPAHASVEDVRNAYLLAYSLGCKGITIYRDGSKAQQVLNVGLSKSKDLGEGVSSVYYKFESGYGPVHIHIDHIDGKPFRVFTNTTPIGTEVAGLTSVLGIMISKYLEIGGDINEVVKTGDAILGSTFSGLGFWREGLNDSGQLAFYGELANG
ncbi:MAG: adenosylcobalamin-dependent ribonucleoside-diphosphate reductase, partial [Planctomycetota bacterium]